MADRYAYTLDAADVTRVICAVERDMARMRSTVFCYRAAQAAAHIPSDDTTADLAYIEQQISYLASILHLLRTYPPAPEE